MNPDFSAVLSFTVVDRLDAAVKFSASFSLTSFTDACEEAKLELRDTCYAPNLAAPVDPTCWQCWSGLSGTISALPGTAYSGLVLSVTRFMNQPQYGAGANGKNSHLGLSFWFHYSLVAGVDHSIPGTRPCPHIPSDAHGDCNIDLIPPPPVIEPPQAKGDPHFIGFCANVPTCRYDFHGERDRVFAIVSDQNLQLNARFVGADLRPEKMFKTYIGAVGLRLPSSLLRVECDRDDERHIIELDGSELPALTIRSFETPDGPATVSRDDQDRVSIDLPRYFFKLRFSSSSHSSCHINMRANYRAAIRADSSLLQRPGSKTPHGVLGQTADSNREFPSFGTGPQGEGMVEGSWQDYLIANDNLFGTQFTFTRWAPPDMAVSSSFVGEGQDPSEKAAEALTEDGNDDDSEWQRHDDDNIVEKSAGVH